MAALEIGLMRAVSMSLGLRGMQMHFNFVASLVATIIVALILCVFYKLRRDNEPYLGLKLVVYFVVGGFVFTVNAIPVPIGFLLYLLLLHPKANPRVKRYAAILGIAVAFLGRWLPA